MEKVTTFDLLWDMANEIREDGGSNTGTIISRYAGILDDRIENSGNSRSTQSLRLYTVEQLQDELDERTGAFVAEREAAKPHIPKAVSWL